jgi:hypothetical protein
VEVTSVEGEGSTFVLRIPNSQPVDPPEDASRVEQEVQTT